MALEIAVEKQAVILRSPRGKRGPEWNRDKAEGAGTGRRSEEPWAPSMETDNPEASSH